MNRDFGLGEGGHITCVTSNRDGGQMVSTFFFNEEKIRGGFSTKEIKAEVDFCTCLPWVPAGGVTVDRCHSPDVSCDVCQEIHSSMQK